MLLLRYLGLNTFTTENTISIHNIIILYITTKLAFIIHYIMLEYSRTKHNTTYYVTERSDYMSKKSKKTFLSLLVIVILVANATLVNALENGATKSIQLLATSDIHNHFYPYQYMIDAEYNDGSLAKVASVVKEKRIENPNTILIDNGDTIQDNSSVIFLDEDIMPMVAGMNALQYDAWTAGNHEFNYGMDVLQRVINTFDGDFLLSNVYKGEPLPENRVPNTSNYTIIERDGVKTAIIGAVTPNIIRWDKDHLEGYTVTDPLDEITAAVNTIRSNNEADIVVVSFHASINGEYPGLTDSARVIAENVEGIDAIVSGHAHTLENQIINDVVVVAPSYYGQYVSQINFDVQRKNDNSGYEIVNIQADNIKTKEYDADPELLELLLPYHQKALEDARSVIGRLEGGNLVPEAEIPGIPQAQISDTPLIDLILTVQMQEVERSITIPEDVKHVSSTALFLEDSNVFEGDFRKADVANIYRYDNTLMTIKTTGKVLSEYLEWSAQYYNTFQDGDLTVSFNPLIRIYNYDMFGGIDYKINITNPVGHRIEQLVYSDDKVAVQDDDTIYLTVNNYRANGALNDIIDGNLEIIYDSKNNSVSTIREMIVEYIIEQSVIYPTVDNNWEITGTSWHPQRRDVVRQLVNKGGLGTTYSDDGRTPNVKPIRWEDVEEAATVVSLASVNDFHGAVFESGLNPGVAKFATVVRNFTSTNKNPFFLGSGDLYQGSAISNLTHGKIMNDVFKELGMVYSAIGNHEFDWGIDKIPTFMEDGGFTFLAANIVYLDGSRPSWAQPTAMLEVEDIKVGIIGLTTPDTKYQTVPQNVANLEFLDPVETARKYEQELYEQGADSVIVLSHLGSAPEGATNYHLEAEALAEALPTLDGIFSAHHHLTVNKVVNTVPILQGSHNGRALSKLTLVFDSDGDLISNFGDIEDISAQIDRLIPDPVVSQIIEDYQSQFEGILNEKIASTPNRYSHNTNQHPVSDMGQLTAKIMSEIGNTDIAIINGGGIRNGLYPGDITIGNMYDIFPFDNTLVTLDLTGAELKQVIEHGLPPCDFRPGQFYGIHVYYEYDQEGQSIITNMFLLDGTEIEMTETYRISTLDFLVTGGDRYDFSNATNIHNTMIPLRDSIIDWMKDTKVIDFIPTQNVFLQSNDGTSIPWELQYHQEVTMFVDEKTNEQDFIDALAITSNYPIDIHTDFMQQVDLTKDGRYEINVTFQQIATQKHSMQVGNTYMEDTIEVTIIAKENPPYITINTPSDARPIDVVNTTPATGDTTAFTALYTLLGLSTFGIYMILCNKIKQ